HVDANDYLVFTRADASQCFLPSARLAVQQDRIEFGVVGSIDLFIELLSCCDTLSTRHHDVVVTRRQVVTQLPNGSLGYAAICMGRIGFEHFREADGAEIPLLLGSA